MQAYRKKAHKPEDSSCSHISHAVVVEGRLGKFANSDYWEKCSPAEFEAAGKELVYGVANVDFYGRV